MNICPDCGHKASDHTSFSEKTYRCIGSGRCVCQKTPAEVYQSIISKQSDSIKNLCEATERVLNWMKHVDFRLAKFDDVFIYSALKDALKEAKQ